MAMHRSLYLNNNKAYNIYFFSKMLIILLSFIFTGIANLKKLEKAMNITRSNRIVGENNNN
jgi:hypothetical protein